MSTLDRSNNRNMVVSRTAIVVIPNRSLLSEEMLKMLCSLTAKPKYSYYGPLPK